MFFVGKHGTLKTLTGFTNGKFTSFTAAITLNKTQRLAYIGTTAAMGSCPLNAQEALLGIPYHAAAIEQGLNERIQTVEYQQTKIGKSQGPPRKLKNFMDQPFFKIQNHCVTKVILPHCFRPTILARTGWDKQVFKHRIDQRNGTSRVPPLLPPYTKQRPTQLPYEHSYA